MVLALSGCFATKENQEHTNTNIAQIKYTAITRGSNKGVIITSKTIDVIQTRLSAESASVSKTISKADWDELVAMAQEIDPEKKMGSFEAPSKKHQFDGAMAANLIISAGNTHYSSVTFDDGNPPAEIAELVNKVIALSGIDKAKNNED